MTKPIGFLHELRWYSPYTEPPSGQPRVLAEVYLPIEHPDCRCGTAEFCALFRPGNGYVHNITAISPPPRPQKTETTARLRRLRVERRMQKRAPLFTDELLADELERRSAYYAGGIDPGYEHYEEARNEKLAQWHAVIDDCQKRPGVLIVHSIVSDTLDTKSVVC